MKADIETIEINGIEYIRKDAVTQMAPKSHEGLEYVIVRAYSAGVFAGYLESRKDQEAVVRNARRIWKWAGAASLSQLAIDGTAKPNECKFPQEVDKIILMNVIEILSVTAKAQKSISEVKVWKL